MTFRSNRPKEVAAKPSRCGRRSPRSASYLHPEGLPDLRSTTAPTCLASPPAGGKANGIGLATNGWGADWNDGFGFLSQIIDGRTIREAENYNLSVKDPAVDALVDEPIAEQGHRHA